MTTHWIATNIFTSYVYFYITNRTFNQRQRHQLPCKQTFFVATEETKALHCQRPKKEDSLPWWYWVSFILIRINDGSIDNGEEWCYEVKGEPFSIFTSIPHSMGRPLSWMVSHHDVASLKHHSNDCHIMTWHHPDGCSLMTFQFLLLRESPLDFVPGLRKRLNALKNRPIWAPEALFPLMAKRCKLQAVS